MKIALPTDENTMDSGICMSYGRTPYFMVYDTESKKSYSIDNSAVANEGGAGIKASQIIADNGVNIVITPRCGENAVDVLKAADIELYKSIDVSAMENIKAFEAGKLILLKDFHKGFHGHGGK